jgi:hypothetical protein
MQLVLRRANVSRISGHWDDDDYDVFDCEQDVGRIYRANAHEELWFWGVSFDITHRKSYGYALSLEEAKAAFREEYLAWKGTRTDGDC